MKEKEMKEEKSEGRQLEIDLEIKCKIDGTHGNQQQQHIIHISLDRGARDDSIQQPITTSCNVNK